jgi:CheY-like chemotaxis protein
MDNTNDYNAEKIESLKMEALGRMTRGLVHDFNNSLASIMGYAEFLVADLPADSEPHLFASNIKLAGGQMQELLDQIRSFAKIEKLETGHITSKDNEPHHSKCILLVEDRDILRHTLETMITREGHTVEGLADGLVALDRLREHPDRFDCVITDFTMPMLNGKDLIDEIRHDFPNIPIILISGDSEHLRNVQNEPSNQYIHILEKPVSVQSLKTTIKKATQKQSQKQVG